MEFKYRAIDEQVSSSVPNQSSSLTYFTEQALRAGYSSTDFRRAHELLRNPSDVRETIRRELEKERIREEIIASEIARKRVLEAEVRREMLVEREMALRRGENFPFMSSSASVLSMVRFEPNRYEGRSFEERITMSLEDRLGYLAAAQHEIGGLEMVPFRPSVVEPKISEIVPPRPRVEPNISELKPVSEVSKEKERIILLAKPDVNLSGVKRKAVTPPAVGAGELPPGSAFKKKIKEEWSCALCQVSATNEQGLNEHLQGKKHKAREAGLWEPRYGIGIGLFPKKTSRPTKVIEISGNPSSEVEGKTKGEVLQVNKKGKASLKKNLVLEKQNGAPMFPKNQTHDSKKKNGEAVEKQQKNADYKKRCRFWCEMCQIGAYSGKVMDAHKNGKKHMIRLQEVNQNGGIDSTTLMVEATQKGNGVEELPMMENKRYW